MFNTNFTIAAQKLAAAKEEKKELAKDIADAIFDQSAASDSQAMELVAERYGANVNNLLVSRKGNLRMVYTNKSLKVDNYFRSVLINARNQVLVEFPDYPIEMTVSEIKTDGKKVKIMSESPFEVDADKIELFRGVSGTQVAVARIDGQNHIFTATNADPKNSTFGSRSPKFLDIFAEALEANNVTLDSLFGKEKNSSNFHIFILLHNTLLLCDKISFAKSSLAYMGVFKNDLTSDDAVFMPEGMIKELPLGSKDSFILQQTPVSVSQAQEHLTYGWNPEKKDEKVVDPRLSYGEYIVAKIYDNEGGFTYYRFNSPAYAYRSEMAGLNQSRESNLNYNLTNLKAKDLAPYLLDEKELAKGNLVFSPENLSKEIETDPVLRAKVIRHTFLWSVNPADQEEVMKLVLREKKVDLNELRSWLADIFARGYLRTQKYGTPGHNKHVYFFLSARFNELKKMGPLPAMNQLAAQKAAMYKFLSSYPFSDEQELYRITKARAHIDKKFID